MGFWYSFRFFAVYRWPMASSGWQLTLFPVAPPPYFRPGPNNYQVQSDKLQLCDRIIVIVRASPESCEAWREMKGR